MNTMPFEDPCESRRGMVLPMRERDRVIHQVLRKRLETLLPMAMRETGFDMWLVICQEDNPDPVFQTMIPLNTWAPILQMLIFSLPEGGSQVERINLSMTQTGDLYTRPWSGRNTAEQWQMLAEIIAERKPRRIGINTGSIQWAAGGLTYNLYQQLCQAVPGEYHARMTSAETLATRWLATLTDEEIELFQHVASLAHGLIKDCYSRASLMPGVTTTADLEWLYWQRAVDLGLEVSFKPFFNLVRSDELKEKYGEDDLVIRGGDLIHCDVGVRYLRLNSDHQQWAYVRRGDEQDAPAGLRSLLHEGNRLQNVFMAEFQPGLSGNELLQRILERARAEGIPNPKVYSHSLGLFLHEPGPLIGLPWEQENTAGRGEVRLNYNNAFTMELSVRDRILEWNGQEVTLSMEEDVVFTEQGCRLLDGRQVEFYLV